MLVKIHKRDVSKCGAVIQHATSHLYGRESVRKTRKVNSGSGYVAEISVRFVLVHNSHTASDSLVEISFDHRHQLIRGLEL
jgi:hypothetical protein